MEKPKVAAQKVRTVTVYDVMVTSEIDSPIEWGHEIRVSKDAHTGRCTVWCEDGVGNEYGPFRTRHQAITDIRQRRWQDDEEERYELSLYPPDNEWDDDTISDVVETERARRPYPGPRPMPHR